MVQKPCYAHSLLLATAENIFPHFLRVPAAFAVGDVSQLCFLEDLAEFNISSPGVFHIGVGMGIDDLVA